MNCPICSSDKIVDFRKSKNRNLVRCLSCNAVFVKAEAGPKRDLILETGGRFFNEYLKYEGLFRSYFTEKLASIEKYKSRGHLLDVGCGIGTFLRVAKSRGWDVLGIDLSISSVTYARQTGVEVENVRIEDLGNHSTKFDAVTIFQTIEHMEDPRDVLVRARQLLKEGGILVVTTPNRESLLGKVLMKRWFGYYNEEHLFFFDRKSFESLVVNAGFEIISSQADSGKPLTFSWIFIRLADYYYNHRKTVQVVINFLKTMAKLFDWLKLREPMVDLIIIAKVG